VHFEQVWLTNFRNYVSAELTPAPEGVTLLQGDNGAGKTNLLEAVAFLALLRSFRGVTSDTLVRDDAVQAVLRGKARREGRTLLVETEMNRGGKTVVQVNRQVLRRTRDLSTVLSVTIFSPDDLDLVKGGPQARRDYLDDLLEVLQPRYSAVRADAERALRQRNALLRSAAGALRGSMASMLDVWDTKFAEAGESVAAGRELLASSLRPEVQSAYRELSARAGPAGRTVTELTYERSWRGGLREALQAARAEDVRRGLTTVGPQRDDVCMSLGHLPARTHASQGEQRSLALALRLGGHALVSARTGSGPVLLLDDVFSELDAWRCSALASCLPPGQALLTAAGAPPGGLALAARVEVRAGSVVQTGRPGAAQASPT
jgi:DNA replication and repair protein RecF